MNIIIEINTNSNKPLLIHTCDCGNLILHILRKSAKLEQHGHGSREFSKNIIPLSGFSLESSQSVCSLKTYCPRQTANAW